MDKQQQLLEGILEQLKTMNQLRVMELYCDPCYHKLSQETINHYFRKVGMKQPLNKYSQE